MRCVKNCEKSRPAWKKCVTCACLHVFTSAKTAPNRKTGNVLAQSFLVLIPMMNVSAQGVSTIWRDQRNNSPNHHFSGGVPMTPFSLTLGLMTSNFKDPTFEKAVQPSVTNRAKQMVWHFTAGESWRRWQSAKCWSPNLKANKCEASILTGILLVSFGSLHSLPKL